MNKDIITHRIHVFDAYCREVVKNRALNLHDQFDRRENLEINLSALSEATLNRLCCEDQYEYPAEMAFLIRDMEIPVRDKLLADALAALPVKKRNVILLSYFLEMSNREIANELDMTEAAISTRKSSGLARLRRWLEGLSR